MRIVVLIAILLVAAPALAPPAAAQPCEVPGCNVVGFAACVVANAKDFKQWREWLPECATQPASVLA